MLSCGVGAIENFQGIQAENIILSCVHECPAPGRQEGLLLHELPEISVNVNT